MTLEFYKDYSAGYLDGIIDGVISMLDSLTREDKKLVAEQLVMHLKERYLRDK